MTGLPSSWTWTTIDAVAANRRNAIKAGPFGSALKKEYYAPSGYKIYGQEQVIRGDARFGDYYISPERYESLASCAVQPRDVLLSLVGTIGRTLIVPPYAEPGIINPRLLKISLDERAMLAEYFAYLLQAPQTRQILENQAHGGTMEVLNLSILRGIPIPLAPRAEQERIVAAIEEQVSRLDAGVAALERARQNLRRMRSAVLQAAMEDAAVSSGGPPVRLSELLLAPLANGRSVPDGPEDGYPVLRLTAVREGQIDLTQAKRGAWTEEEASPFRVEVGDFLVVRGNGSKHLVGRGGLVTTAKDVAFPDTLIRVRFDPRSMIPAFGSMIWDSRFVRNQIESAARTTAGIYKINQQSLGQLQVPAPSLGDQERIVRAAEAQFSVLERANVAVEVASARSQRLRSSILAAAFSGKLVPQNPNDEPASVLLDRIAAERAGSSPNGRRPSRKPHQERVPL